MNSDVVELTQQLVRIPSLNPMGKTSIGPNDLETRVTDFLEDWAKQLGLQYERHTVMPARDNLLARLPSPDPDCTTTLLLEVHQDTVPIDGMTIEPFGGEIQDGRLYGRGACDVKGGMAAMMSAIATLKAAPSPAQPNIVIAFTVNEENGFDGVRHLCGLWNRQASDILRNPPTFAIVAEPTELNIVVAHKGTVRWRCRTHGLAAHSSNPSAGKNAIYRMARVLNQLERYAKEAIPEVTDHPDLGGPTLSVGTIHGGISVNTVPDECMIEIDRRVLPCEVASEARDHVLGFLAKHVDTSCVTHDPPFLSAPGLRPTNNQAIATRLSQVVQQRSESGRIIGVPFGTDAGALSAAGVPTVVFGPGSIQQAHTKDEWIDIHSLHEASEILIRFAQSAQELAVTAH